MHKIKFTKNASEDIDYWKKSDVKVYNRLKDIIRDIAISPYDGIGKPEPLKYSLSGKWSRRLTKEHRLVYELKDREIIIYQCRFHY